MNIGVLADEVFFVRLSRAFALGSYSLYRLEDAYEVQAAAEQKSVDMLAFFLPAESDCEEQFEILSGISKIRVPKIIFIPGNEISQKLKAFAYGADDVIPAQSQAAEVVARFTAVLRRFNGLPPGPLSSGPITLDPEQLSCFVDGRLIPMTPKEYKLLECLFIRKGRVQTKEVILSYLYQNEIDTPELRIIDVFVYKLRRKLSSFGVKEVIIKTVWGLGYVVE